MKQPPRRKRLALAASAAIALTVGLVACTPASAQPSSVTVGPDTVIIDVRTPEEFASGHLGGALNIDFNGGAVPVAIPTLDPNAEYLVYCRSGNRSGQAMRLMEDAGFTNLTNLGSLEQAAAATGVAVVK